MAAPITHDHWTTTRQSLAQSAARFARLLSTARGGAMATADWSVADTAAHVASIARLCTAIVRAGSVPLPYTGIEDMFWNATVDTVADLNRELLRQFTERDPAALADHLRTDVEDILHVSETADPGEPLAWLGSARVPVAGVLAHLLNEILLHGRDIGRATRTDWVIPPQDIGLFFELFVAGMTRNGVGHLLDSTEPAPERRLAVEFRSRYTAPMTMVLQDRRVFVEEPGGGTDVRVSFDPPTLSLMLFGRIGRMRALLSGKVVVTGRRPWLLPVFMRTVRFPG